MGRRTIAHQQQYHDYYDYAVERGQPRLRFSILMCLPYFLNLVVVLANMRREMPRILCASKELRERARCNWESRANGALGLCSCAARTASSARSPKQRAVAIVAPRRSNVGTGHRILGITRFRTGWPSAPALRSPMRGTPGRAARHLCAARTGIATCARRVDNASLRVMKADATHLRLAARNTIEAPPSELFCTAASRTVFRMTEPSLCRRSTRESAAVPPKMPPMHAPNAIVDRRPPTATRPHPETHRRRGEGDAMRARDGTRLLSNACATSSVAAQNEWLQPPRRKR